MDDDIDIGEYDDDIDIGEYDDDDDDDDQLASLGMERRRRRRRRRPGVLDVDVLDYSPTPSRRRDVVVGSGGKARGDGGRGEDRYESGGRGG